MWIAKYIYKKKKSLFSLKIRTAATNKGSQIARSWVNLNEIHHD